VVEKKGFLGWVGLENKNYRSEQANEKKKN